MKKYIFILIILFPFVIKATIVIPPEDYGVLIDNSDLVVYCTILGHHNGNPYHNEIIIKRLIKGDLVAGEEVIIEEYGQSIGDLVSVISGDTDFKVGNNYLVFLSKVGNGFFKSRLMALSVFVEENIQGEQVFLHEGALRQISIVGDNSNISLEDMFLVNRFIPHLIDISNDNIAYSYLEAGQLFLQGEIEEETNAPIPLVLGACPNPKPAHCTILAGNPNDLNSTCNVTSPGKYASNVWTAYVAGGAQSDPSTTTEIADVQNAIMRLDGMPGVDITYGGIDAAFSASEITCTPNISYDRLDFGGGTNDVYIFFDDPCNEIPALSGCSGTVGLGGHWTYSNCHTDICGDQWRNSTFPYFLYNDGAGCVGSDKYSSIAIHEMLHSLGLDHIADTCTAILNPIICDSLSVPPDYGVSLLDDECTDWLYNITPTVPIKLSSFTAELVGQNVLVDWTVTAEIDNEIFIVERSFNNKSWELVVKVKGAGTSSDLVDYSAIDYNPYGNTSYYRLKQQDFEGSISYSDIVTIINRSKDEYVFISPNPFSREFVIEGYFESDYNSVEIYDSKGGLMYSCVLSSGLHNKTIFIDNLEAGVYIVKIRNAKSQETIRIVKI